MWLDHIGPFGFYNKFRDDWLVSRRAMALFLLAALFVVATIPILFGRIDTAKLPHWANLPLGLEGVMGPLSIFFLWFGMWRYWVRLDNSSKLAKRLSFMLLLFGMFYGSALYYFLVYLPQVTNCSWTTAAKAPPEREARRPRDIQKIFFSGILLLAGLGLVFGLILPVFLKRDLPGLDGSGYEYISGLCLSASAFSYIVFLVAMLSRLGKKSRNGEIEIACWGLQRIMAVGFGFILGFVLVFVLVIPILLKDILPPEYEDNYEIFLGLGVSLSVAVVLVYLLVMLIRTSKKYLRQSQVNARPPWKLQKVWLAGVLSLFGFMLVFGLLFSILT